MSTNKEREPNGSFFYFKYFYKMENNALQNENISLYYNYRKNTEKQQEVNSMKKRILEFVWQFITLMLIMAALFGVLVLFG